jgi:hypothetical protein
MYVVADCGWIPKVIIRNIYRYQTSATYLDIRRQMMFSTLKGAKVL